MGYEEKFMLEAARIAGKGVDTCKGGPFGSVVVRNGEVVGSSSNRVFETNDPTAHAEVMAIRDAAKRLGTPELEGCEIYSVGEPCPMCLAAIYWARIEKVYFANTKEQAARLGFDDSFIYKELASTFHERTLTMQHTPINEAADLFDKWRNMDTEGLPQT